MGLGTKVGSSFDRDADAFGLTLLTVSNRLNMIGRAVAAESVVKVSDEVVSVFLIQGHEGTTHYNEFDLVAVVA